MPQANAVIIYMMDVSGSMGEEQKEIVRIESFWIDTWLRHHYKGVEIRYIIHDAEAREVDRDTFYHTRESGGTVISAAYKLCSKIVDLEYPTDEWNIYCLHFSDGDNWSQGDTEECMSILKTQVLARVNLRSEEHTSELQSLAYLVCRLLLEKKKTDIRYGVSSVTVRVACPR